MALIERDVLIKRFCGHCIDYGKCIEKCFDVEIIESIPPVDAEPVRYGEWIDPHDPWTGGICSACGYQTGERMGHLKLHYRYCPNCGARMDAERKEE